MQVSQTFLINNIWTDVYARISKSPSPFRIVVIPGNPGSVTVYEQFIDEIFRLLGQKCSVLGLSHAGHGAPGKNGDKIFTVVDQITHKVEFLKGLVAKTWPELCEASENQPNDFVIMGHSIGAFIGLKAWNRTLKSTLNITDAFLLMPTICELYKGYSMFNRVVTLPYIRNFFASLAHYIPGRLLRSVASNIGNQGDKLGEMVSTKIDYYTVMNVTTMGHEEGATIFGIDEEITSILDKIQERAYFIYSPKDPYTPSSIIDETKTKFPKANYTMSGPHVTHAFVINNSIEIAQSVVSKLVNSSFPNMKSDLQPLVATSSSTTSSTSPASS